MRCRVELPSEQVKIQAGKIREQSAWQTHLGVISMWRPGAWCGHSGVGRRGLGPSLDGRVRFSGALGYSAGRGGGDPGWRSQEERLDRGVQRSIGQKWSRERVVSWHPGGEKARKQSTEQPHQMLYGQVTWGPRFDQWVSPWGRGVVGNLFLFSINFFILIEG